MSALAAAQSQSRSSSSVEEGQARRAWEWPIPPTVVSPGSEVRDPERKPQLYAESGIRHLWRVEEEGGYPVVYVYELGPATKAYAVGVIHRERVKLAVPFDIDLTAIDRM